MNAAETTSQTQQTRSPSLGCLRCLGSAHGPGISEAEAQGECLGKLFGGLDGLFFEARGDSGVTNMRPHILNTCKVVPSWFQDWLLAKIVQASISRPRVAPHWVEEHVATFEELVTSRAVVCMWSTVLVYRFYSGFYTSLYPETIGSAVGEWENFGGRALSHTLNTIQLIESTIWQWD